jgi:hypothetical protein
MLLAKFRIQLFDIRRRNVMAEDRVQKLLAELNEWEKKYGPRGGGKRLVSSGEANARIEELKRLLRELDVEIDWNGLEYEVIDHPDGRTP